MTDHVSALDQAQAHVAGSVLRLDASSRLVERSIDCVVRGDERVESSLDRVARGHVRRAAHVAAWRARRR
jgi:hypothetical protein